MDFGFSTCFRCFRCFENVCFVLELYDKSRIKIHIAGIRNRQSITACPPVGTENKTETKIGNLLLIDLLPI